MDAGTGEKRKAPSKAEIVCKLNSGEFDIYLPKSKKSKCWENFGHPRVCGTDTVYSSYAVCKKCNYVYTYDSKKGNSQLNSHKCPAEPSTSSQTQTRLSEFNVVKSRPKQNITILPQEVKSRLNELAAITCAVDMRPLSVFEGKGMIKFCQELIDTTSHIGRFDFKTTIVDHHNLSRKYLQDVYKKYRADVQEELSHVISMGHNTDGWQDKFTGTDYMSLICFYINNDWEWRKIVWATEEFDVPSKNAEAVRKWYLDHLDEIGLDYKRHWIVADNASVMECAFKELNGAGCAAHCINLVVVAMTDGVLEVKELLKNAKKLVTHAKKTGIQKKLPRRLCQSMSVRWNSSLKMIQSIEAVWVEMTQVLIERNEAAYLTGINIMTLRELLDFLKLFKTATDVMESDNQPNIHLVLYWYFRMQKHLTVSEDDSDIIEQLKTMGLRAMHEKWAKRLRPIHYAATLLDPRAKNCKLAVDQRIAGEDFIKDLYFDLNPEAENRTNEQDDIDKDEEDFYATGTDANEHEFDAYMRELPVNVKSGEELLKYWKESKSKGLARVAKVVLSVPASSATSERSFSDAGFTINIRRTSLRPANVDKLLFVRSAMRMPVFPEDEILDLDDDDT